MSDDGIIKIQSNEIAEVQDRQAWEDALSTWLKNYKSKNTRKKYGNILREFFQWVDKWFTEVTQLDVIEWRDYLENDREVIRHAKDGTVYHSSATLSDASVNLFLSAVSSFYAFAKDKGLISENPVDGVKRHTVNPYGRATYLNVDKGEDLTLLNSIDRDSVKGLRDRAIILLMLTTAVRVSAVAEAKIRDLIELNGQWYLNYRNKGGEQQTALITSPVMKAIRAYLDTRDGLSDEGSLFQSVIPNPVTGWDLSGTAITNMVARRAQDAGLHHVTAHSLRHTAAIQAIQHGSLGDVQKLLKHKSNRVTLVYVDHIEDSKADEMTEKLSSRYD